MSVRAVNRNVLPEPGFVIGGEKLTGLTDEVYEHRYAATGELTHEIPLAGQAEMDSAVAAARKAFPAWKRLSGSRRRRLMLDLAAKLRSLEEELRQLQTAEIGQAYATTVYSTTWVSELFEYNAGWADKIGGQVVSTSPGPAFDYTLDEPYGVVAVIVPWNGPFIGFSQVVAPALAAGNTIVAKPSELSPYITLRVAELALEVGFPPGVLNVVPGGATAGTALTSHPGVNKIFFTGGGATASKIVEATAANLTPLGLELGGKSARLIFDDADLDAAAEHAVSSILGLTGQQCIAGSRVLVQSNVYDEVIERAKKIVENTAVGDPQDPGVFTGPVICEAAAARIMGFIERARAADAGRVVTGGERMGGDFENGYFIRPTIFADVKPDSEIAVSEVFGPVQAFMRFESEEDAIAIANDTEYGLAAWIETEDLARAHRVARDLDAGTVWINGFFDLPVGAPFGGVKRSGHGRLGGPYGIQEFTQPKNVWFPL